MIFEHFSKNKKFILIVSTIILVAGVFIFLYSSVIFQEGNPWPQVKGIIQLNFTSQEIVRLSGPENGYMTKSINGVEILKQFMGEKGYQFIEQMGAGYFFESAAGNGAVVTRRDYSRFYSLWRITEGVKVATSSLAEELGECLPKSDMESYERCKELLKQITDFDSCVGAGFSIMKSNPPQCATPDGRTFIQLTNSTWEQAVVAIKNCEVKKVFQAHSRIVTLTLDNGNKLIAKEPQIDDIFTELKDVEPECGRIQMATE